MIDHVRIMVTAGNGGNGSASFRTAKYVPNGGPDGGDGGDGGSVVLVGDGGLSTLQEFRYKRIYKAGNGEDGSKQKRSGKSAPNLEIHLPLGSIVREAGSQELLVDIVEDGQRFVVAKGGRGGFGNIHFANSVRQAPNFAKAGKRGESLELSIELKLLADVALLGFPNIGKSTLLSVLSRAKPKVANYAFTTIEPVLGIVERDHERFVMADIPGLIEGASEGLGLGLDFLRHSERSRLILQLVDMSATAERKAIDQYRIIRRELERFSRDLADRAHMVVGTRTDLADPAELQTFRNEMARLGERLFFVCAPTHEGLQDLLDACFEILSTLPKPMVSRPVERRAVYRFEPKTFRLEKVREGVFRVEADWAEELIMSINFNDVESTRYFQKRLKALGVSDALEAAGIQEGDLVCLNDYQFDYVP